MAEKEHGDNSDLVNEGIHLNQALAKHFEAHSILNTSADLNALILHIDKLTPGYYQMIQIRTGKAKENGDSSAAN